MDNTTTLLARKQYLDRLTRADDFAMIAAIAMSGADEGDRVAMARDDAPAPALAPNDATNDQKGRQQRFRRRMERGLASVHLDSARFLAQFSGATPEARAQAAQRLLLAIGPQQAPDRNADSLALVRELLLDAAYQLK